MSTYYAKLKGTQLCDTNRATVGSNNSNQSDLSKADYILCIAIGQDGMDTTGAAYTLQWRLSGGSFANVGSTGAVKYSTGTVLSNGTALTSGNAKVSVSNMTWQNGEEVEDAVSASIDLGSDYYTELQFGISFADATGGATYEFQLYSSAQSAAISIETGSYLTCSIVADNYNLVVSDVTAASAMDGGLTLAQIIPLYPADISSSSGMDNVGLTQAHTLTMSDMTAASASDNVTLTQAHTLAMADMGSASGTGTLDLTQVHNLAVGDLTSAAGSDNLDITQNTLYPSGFGTLLGMWMGGIGGFYSPEAGTSTIIVWNLESATGAENVALTQAHTLEVQGLTAAAGEENITVVYHDVLTSVADMTVVSGTGNIALTQAHTLANVADISAATGGENITLTQAHTLAGVAEVSAASTTDGNLTLTENKTLAVADMTAASGAGNIDLTQVHFLAVDSIAAASAAANIALTHVHNITMQDIAAASSLEGSLILQTFNPGVALFANNILYGGEAKRCLRRT